MIGNSKEQYERRSATRNDNYYWDPIKISSLPPLIRWKKVLLEYLVGMLDRSVSSNLNPASQFHPAYRSTFILPLIFYIKPGIWKRARQNCTRTIEMRTNLCRGSDWGREPREAATVVHSWAQHRAHAIRDNVNHLLEQ